MLGYEKVYLIEETGEVVCTIVRCPTVVVRTSDDRLGGGRRLDCRFVTGQKQRDRGGVAVSLYSSQGEPIRTFLLPPTEDWSIPASPTTVRTWSSREKKGSSCSTRSGRLSDGPRPRGNKTHFGRPSSTTMDASSCSLTVGRPLSVSSCRDGQVATRAEQFSE